MRMLCFLKHESGQVGGFRLMNGLMLGPGSIGVGLHHAQPHLFELTLLTSVITLVQRFTQQHCNERCSFRLQLPRALNVTV